MNVILDYDVGNLDSVMRAFTRSGMDTVISKDKATIEAATSLILPGVGAFNEAVASLKKSGLIPLIRAHIEADKPLLGICLGMQLLYESSSENGYTEGLGILKGTIEPLPPTNKVPHMGWNALRFNRPAHPLLSKIDEHDYVYFVHSYYADCDEEDVIAYADYGKKVPAIVARGNVYATQFHPEKSSTTGLNILKAYKEMIR